MELQQNKEGVRTIILPQNRHYFYSVRPFELTNMLGATIALLQEYFIQDTNGEQYKLYKTKEGNWYEIADEVKAGTTRLFTDLKMAIDSIETRA